MQKYPYIFTGGPGTGKSTVLHLLSDCGYTCVAESAREIIKARLDAGLTPRQEAGSFAQAILEKDIAQYETVRHVAGPVFIDRGIVDALSMLTAAGVIKLADARKQLQQYPVARDVFFFHPWITIYTNDAQRDQTYDECLEVSARLAAWYRSLGFTLIDMPELDAEARRDFVLERIQSPRSE